MLNPRLPVDLLLALGLTFLPWWLIATLALGAALVFPHYLELILLALMYDLIYAVAGESRLITFELTLMAVSAYAILHLLKRYTRLYD